MRGVAGSLICCLNDNRWILQQIPGSTKITLFWAAAKGIKKLKASTYSLSCAPKGWLPSAMQWPLVSPCYGLWVYFHPALIQAKQGKTFIKACAKACFSPLKQVCNSEFMFSGVFFFPELKEFLTSYSTRLSTQCLLIFLSLLPCFLLKCSEGEIAAWPARA